jgi:two-component system phosphate regulon response regulator PhoB
VGRILVIDDDTDIAALVGLKLELDGHSVETEQDGAAGLARAQADPPDLIIVDWTLPSLTGPEICARVREDPALTKTWLIMLTARPLDGDALAQTRADEVVAKPFSPRMLSERVNAALSR